MQNDILAILDESGGLNAKAFSLVRLKLLSSLSVLGPDGATFSPDITLIFTYPGARWGEDYSIKAYDPVTQGWTTLPTTYSPEKGTITATLSHFCCFALFSSTHDISFVSARQVPAQVSATPIPTSPPPGTAVNIFVNMLLWAATLVSKNLILLVVAAIIVIIIYFVRRKKRLDRIRYML